MSESKPSAAAGNRVGKGVPTGGQFAASTRAEADVALDATSLGGVETIEGAWCESCCAAHPLSDTVRLYECQNCGATSTERRCEQCNKFMARSEDVGCPDCEEPVEEGVDLVEDHDGTLVRAEDFEPDGPSVAERAEQARRENEARSAAQAVARREERSANSEQKTWGSVRVGDVLIDPDDDRRFATECEVMALRSVPGPEGPLVVVEVYDHGRRTLVRRPDSSIAVSTRQPSEAEQARTRERPVVGYRLRETDEGGLRVGSPVNGISVQIAHGTRDAGTLPMLVLTAGRRASYNDFKMNGMVHVLGEWTDPVQAERDLDVLDQAADRLAAARKVTPGTRAADDDEPTPEQAVTLEEKDWISPSGAIGASLAVGVSDWEPERGAILGFEDQHSSTALTDPDTVRLAVRRAREQLGRLTGVPLIADVVDDAL